MGSACVGRVSDPDRPSSARLSLFRCGAPLGNRSLHATRTSNTLCLHPEPPVTKLRYSRADENCMDGPIIEPRTALWGSRRGLLARPGRAVNRAPATLDGTSPSGACIRLKTPIAMGARLTVNWHREDFSAVARNCRSDGREFLPGACREPTARRIEPAAPPQ